jgi:glycosyltransferase involved in cell wall biosynthesis
VKPLLLACGLPLRRERPSSFQRQLELLARAWRAAGRRVRLTGPRTEGLADAGAAILLGYPDQFPALSDPPAVPMYLWAQCSRPPDPRAFEALTAVPLTPATQVFLRQAGVGRIGPVIPHAVDTAFFRPPDAGRRARARRTLGLGRGFAVGAVGAHTYRKRFDLVLRAFALLAAELPEAVLILHTDRAVSAEGTDLGRLAEALGLGAGFRLSTRELSVGGLRRLYWGLDVLVSLSEWEGFGLPAAEALSCGLPVLTHGTQGPAELAPYRELVVGDSAARVEGGSLLLEARPETAAALLAQAARDPGLRRRLGQEGRLAMERSCSLPRVLAGWERQLAAAPTAAGKPVDYNR